MWRNRNGAFCQNEASEMPGGWLPRKSISIWPVTLKSSVFVGEASLRPMRELRAPNVSCG